MSAVEETQERYLILRRDTRECWTFDAPADVKTFMWGRDFAEYSVYLLFPWLDGDLHAFEQALEAV